MLRLTTIALCLAAHALGGCAQATGAGAGGGATFAGGRSGGVPSKAEVVQALSGETRPDMTFEWLGEQTLSGLYEAILRNTTDDMIEIEGYTFESVHASLIDIEDIAMEFDANFPTIAELWGEFNINPDEFGEEDFNDSISLIEVSANDGDLDSVYDELNSSSDNFANSDDEEEDECEKDDEGDEGGSGSGAKSGGGGGGGLPSLKTPSLPKLKTPKLPSLCTKLGSLGKGTAAQKQKAESAKSRKLASKGVQACLRIIRWPFDFPNKTPAQQYLDNLNGGAYLCLAKSWAKAEDL